VLVQVEIRVRGQYQPACIQLHLKRGAAVEVVAFQEQIATVVRMAAVEVVAGIVKKLYLLLPEQYIQFVLDQAAFRQ
jgi:hypothetical protein